MQPCEHTLDELGDFLAGRAQWFEVRTFRRSDGRQDVWLRIDGAYAADLDIEATRARFSDQLRRLADR